MFAKFISRLLAPLFSNDAFVGLVVTELVQKQGVDAITKDIAKNVYLPHLAAVMVETLDLTEIKQHCADVISASDVVDLLDTGDIEKKVIEGIEISASDVAEHIDLSDLAGELDYSQIANDLDIDYSEIASNLSASDIAGEISVSDIAEEVDMDSVIEAIVNNDDCLDYKALAKALIRELGVARTVEVRSSAS
jgi:hypothetical protein